jgi:hypothetical protein
VLLELRAIFSSVLDEPSDRLGKLLDTKEK